MSDLSTTEPEAHFFQPPEGYQVVDLRKQAFGVGFVRLAVGQISYHAVEQISCLPGSGILCVPPFLLGKTPMDPRPALHAREIRFS